MTTDELDDLVRAAGGNPKTCENPMAYLLTTISERDALRATTQKLVKLAGEVTGVRRRGKPSGRNGGRPKGQRCPCGEMTTARAAKRGHVCPVPTA